MREGFAVQHGDIAERQVRRGYPATPFSRFPLFSTPHLKSHIFKSASSFSLIFCHSHRPALRNRFQCPYLPWPLVRFIILSIRVLSSLPMLSPSPPPTLGPWHIRLLRLIAELYHGVPEGEKTSGIVKSKEVIEKKKTNEFNLASSCPCTALVAVTPPQVEVVGTIRVSQPAATHFFRYITKYPYFPLLSRAQGTCIY